MGNLIKVCGLRDAALTMAAVEAGASAIGFMLAPSKRQIAVTTVSDILGQVEMGEARSVGVVVNEPVQVLHQLREQAALDVLQLAGDETPDVLDGVHGVVWKSLRFQPGTTLDQAQTSIDPWLDHQHPVELVLVDAAVGGAYGGTGHRADWDLAAKLAERYPVMLAGGLNPENVDDAIARVRPEGVDVSSGVERLGSKDSGLIDAFISNARQAFEQTGRGDAVRQSTAESSR